MKVEVVEKDNRQNEKDTRKPKLQALVYDILPPTPAIVDYAIDLKKKS